MLPLLLHIKPHSFITDSTNRLRSRTWMSLSLVICRQVPHTELCTQPTLLLLCRRIRGYLLMFYLWLGRYNPMVVLLLLHALLLSPAFSCCAFSLTTATTTTHSWRISFPTTLFDSISSWTTSHRQRWKTCRPSSWYQFWLSGAALSASGSDCPPWLLSSSVNWSLWWYEPLQGFSGNTLLMHVDVGTDRTACSDGKSPEKCPLGKVSGNFPQWKLSKEFPRNLPSL